jgi:hypothetical protein
MQQLLLSEHSAGGTGQLIWVSLVVLDQCLFSFDLLDEYHFSYYHLPWRSASLILKKTYERPIQTGQKVSLTRRLSRVDIFVLPTHAAADERQLAATLWRVD